MKPKRLLFVDDEPSIRATLPVILRRYGFMVAVAASVPEGLEQIRNHEFNVLLCDLNIERESDGLDLVREMRKINPECVVLILTGYPSTDTAVEATRSGADDYIAKPANADVLVAMIGERLHGSRARGLAGPITCG